MAAEGSPGVYKDLRVVELCRGIPGATAAMYLADFGASVLKIVRPGRPPEAPGALCWDRNKRLLELDFEERGADRTEARRLAAAADVVIIDSVPGDAERWGLDGTTLLRLNETLIHAWLPPYGTAGRWSQLPDDELLLDAVSWVADSHMATRDV